jgi:hypothetical protein
MYCTAHRSGNVLDQSHKIYLHEIEGITGSSQISNRERPQTKLRKHQHQQNITDEMVTEINTNDVLCGRGGATNNHDGNRRFRSTVTEHQPEYLEARKKDKAVIARRIVRIIRERGGRFLRRDENTGEWIDVGDRKAVEKTSQALREGLEVRQHTIGNGSTKKSRRNSESSFDTEERDHKIHRVEHLAPESPALVSDFGSFHFLPELDDELAIMPQFIFHTPQATFADCDNLIAL